MHLCFYHPQNISQTFRMSRNKTKRDAEMHDKSTACTKSFPEEADRPMNYLQLKKAEAYDNTAGTLVVLIKDFINIPSQSTKLE